MDSDDVVDLYCAKSSVLDASDLEWGTLRSSSSSRGRRYSTTLTLTHRPTELEVTLTSEQLGGRTRAQSREATLDLLRTALDQLEPLVAGVVEGRTQQIAVHRHS
jgi:hypothetical protein